MMQTGIFEGPNPLKGPLPALAGTGPAPNLTAWAAFPFPARCCCQPR